MPVVDATFDGRRWHVPLYAGGSASATTREGIELVVRRVLPGTAIRFIDAPAESASPAGHDLASPALAADVKQGRAQPGAPIGTAGAPTPPAAARRQMQPPSATRAGTVPGISPYPGQVRSARESAVRPAAAPVCRAGARRTKRSQWARAAQPSMAAYPNRVREVERPSLPGVAAQLSLPLAAAP